jgi:hypothetical protein
MKIRNGFVSNSSSTSFLISTIKTLTELKNWLVEVYRAMFELSITEAITEVNSQMEFEECSFNRGEAIANEVKEYFTNDGYASGVSLLVESNQELGNNLILISSTRDNSINYSIQNMLEDVFSGSIERIHWG